ncbi:4-diphosphocytidyl-2C-methyl-D-erythritol synthase [Streptomyces sp. PBH53]|uniref:nucleotidyltransferase family protein n=1 Tax=Streptomyces TaxID=1883 RepID=UPI0006566D89|nr:nucleotidyltransferase family protein [Streptomyces sp. PBH53]AKN73771.1 4-diphosphocytidyl-2C-methyl-D-erythritol synthase [Streptomyces sp. PBH53]
MTDNQDLQGRDLPGEVAGLLLAAGGGRRLGGRPKALLPHRGRPLVEHAVGVLRAAGCGRIHVVLGAAAAEVRDRAELGGCVLVDNPDWAAGMGSSLRAGLASLAGTGARAALVSLVDQPGIGPAAAARVLGAYEDEKSLVSAAYAGVRGHPVLFGAAHWAGIAETATGDRGARAYLAAHAAEIRLVECADVAEPYDIDTEADLSHLE